MSRSTQPNAYVSQLKRSPLFRGMEEESILELLFCEGVRVTHFKKGETIFSRDTKQRTLGVLLYGACAVVKTGRDGARIPMSILMPCDLFGAAALFNDASQYVANVTATKSAWALLIREDALTDMMRLDFRVAENYMRYLTARIRFLSGRIDGFLPQSVRERVLYHMQNGAQNGVYTPKKSMSALADALCISRTTLYRAVDELMRDGTIIKQGRAFRLSEGETQ